MNKKELEEGGKMKSYLKGFWFLGRTRLGIALRRITGYWRWCERTNTMPQLWISK